MTKRLSVAFLHNVVSPYRLPVFEEVNKAFDIDVWFCKTKTSDRLWSTNLAGYSFRYRILPVFQIGPFFINYSILWHLIRGRYDLYLVGDFPETAFATYLTILVAKLRRKPVVLWSETLNHDVNYFQGLTISPQPHHRLLRRIMTGLITGYRKLLLRLPNQFVALSAMARQFLVNEGVKSDRIASGIQVMPASLLPAPTVAKADSPYAANTVVLHLGYLNPSKGGASLIEAFRAIPGDSFRLIFAGTGPDESRLRQLAAGDSRIIFTGYVEGPDKANLYSWADLFVLPTLVDCWALVINESLYYGVPAITTTEAGASELLADGRAGRLVPPADTAALTAAMREILENPAKRQKMATAARGLAADLTDSRIGAEPIIEALKKAGEGKS